MAHFGKFELRTTDVDGARAFYAAVFGGWIPDIGTLPDAAVARGAVPHWLGHVGVDDVDAAADAFVERGGLRLGPTHPIPGGARAVVRDPVGAIVAVATPTPASADDRVVWHSLNATDLDRAVTCYRELFGWRPTDRSDLGSLGLWQQFSWRDGGSNVGSMTDISERPGVHPHWLFHFGIDALEPAVDVVLRSGGTAVGPFDVPGGIRVAVCEDAQRAAFALHERSTA